MRARVLSLLLLPSLVYAAPPDDLETTVARMARIGTAFSPSFSPDGSRLAFVSNLGGLPQVWTVPADGGWPEAVTALDDPVGFVEWSPDGSQLAFTLAPGGGMNTQVYLVRPDGTGLRRLTAGGKETNRLSGFSHDGRELALAGNARDSSAIDAYLVGVADGASARRDPQRRDQRLHGREPRRDAGRAHAPRQPGRQQPALVDLATGRETLLTPHEGPGGFDGGVFSPDGRRVYLSSNQGRDLSAFARVVLDAQGRPGPIEVIAARDDAELQQLAIDDSGATAALLWNVAGRSELAFVDLASGRSTPGPALPAEIAFDPVFSRDGRKLALVASGATAPSDIWVLDRTTGALRQLTRSPHAGVELAAWCGRAWCASRPTTASSFRAGSTARPAGAAPARSS